MSLTRSAFNRIAAYATLTRRVETKMPAAVPDGVGHQVPVPLIEDDYDPIPPTAVQEIQRCAHRIAGPGQIS
jgi:hypothetical protein